jgi:Bacterial Ig-like domain (group 2)
MRNKAVTTMFALALAVALAACGGGSSSNNNNGGGGGGGGGTGPTLSSITVTPFAPGVAVGSTVKLTATGKFSDNTTKDITSSVTWSSSNPGQATVAGGTVTGVAPGAPTITATQASKTGTTAVNVVAGSSLASNSTVTGPYTFFLSLADTRGQGFVVGTFTTDGAGKITAAVADVNNASGVKTNQTGGSGTYQVFDDGRGDMTLTVAGTTYSLMFALSNIGSTTAIRGDMISLDSTNVATGYFETQTSNASATGPYAFGVYGLDATATNPTPEAMVGAFTVAGASVTSGQRDTNDGGAAVSTAQAFSGTATAADTNGRGTLSFNSGGTGINFAYYTVTANRIYMVQTDTGVNSALGGTAETQGTGITGSTVAGQYDFLLEHAATSANGTFEKAGRITLVSGGTISGVTEDDDLNDVRVTINGGNWTGPDLHGRIAISATTLNPSNVAGTSNAIAYVVNPSGGTANPRMYMMSTDISHAQPGVGNADKVANTTLFGRPYVFALSELGEPTKSGNLLELGQFSVTGGTSLSGFVVTNAQGTLSTSTLSVTLPASTGREEVTNIPAPGFGTQGMIFYITSTSGGIMLGETPDIDGRFFQQ